MSEFHRFDGFVLRSSNLNVEPPYSTQYSTFYTSYILSEDLPVYFMYRCLRFSYSIRGRSVLIVSYLMTEDKNDVVLKEYQANWLGNGSDDWAFGNASVNLPLKPSFRVGCSINSVTLVNLNLGSFIRIPNSIELVDVAVERINENSIMLYFLFI